LITLQHVDIIYYKYLQNHYTFMNLSNLIEPVFLSRKPGLINISQKRMVNIAKLTEPNPGANKNKNSLTILFCKRTLQI